MTELRFRQFETAADMGPLVWGWSEKDLFENAATGLFRVISGSRGARGGEAGRCGT
jgi:SHS2 domain-containing protein